jgi:aminoglycoside phosphotransferase (APT) family kinase protein
MNPLLTDPLLRDAVEVRELAGLSGAQVFLMTKDSRHWFVRKVAKLPEASARLRGQARKQMAFSNETGDLIYTPRILDEGETDGRYYFDMEFVRGPDGTSYLTRATYEEVAALADRLCNYIKFAASRPPLTEATHGGLFDALYSKLCEVQEKTKRISTEDLSNLFLALDRLRRRGALAATLCHGDLTLQNMVVSDRGEIWVVDLLDAPFEHYWQDVAKLHQDLSGGWYLLEQPPVAQCVLDFVVRQLMSAATALDEIYPQLHALLVASTFVRILPYARTPEQTRFVSERISYFAQQAALPEAAARR